MAAFRQAAAMGADYIELDVQRSRDGRLIVIHDTTVDRTTDGSGAVRELAWTELSRLDAGRPAGRERSGERIPLLEEVLDAFLGRTGLLIELKEPALYPGIETQLADMLRARLSQPASADDRIIVQSFDRAAIRRFHQRLGQVSVAVLTGGRHHLRDNELRTLAGYADYVNTRLSDASRELSARIHAHGLGTMAWTVRERAQAEALLRADVDGIITDDPPLVRRAIDAAAGSGAAPHSP